MQQLRNLSRRLAGLIYRFRGDTRGNLVLIFAIALIPLLAAIGCAIDYSLATRIKAKMQGAADAASVGAIAGKSPGFAAASAMTGNGSVTTAVTDATNIFNGDLASVTGYTNLSVTATVTKTALQLTSTIQYSARVPVVFMKVLGWQYLVVSGTSTSSASLPLYLDFYLMLDVSGSMGLPSTNGEQSRLAAINPDNFSLYPNGCTFACHFSAQNACNQGGSYPPYGGQKYNTNGYCLGYSLSRTAGGSGTPVTSCPTDGTSSCIQLRADAVGYAVTQLFITANASEKVTNQFRIGLYPFIQYLYAYFALTSSISGSSSSSGTINYAAANLASLLDTGANSNLGSGGTHFENAFPSLNTLITSVGTGASTSSTLPYVFLITDGAENPQTQWGGGWSGSNSATTLDPSLCTTLKNRGIVISVLYIPYQPIQNPTTFANSEDFYANSNIANIPGVLQSCASPNFFFTANTPADITTALNAMFNQALVTAHITN
jgi:Flp pilus assembly protein TadG